MNQLTSSDKSKTARPFRWQALAAACSAAWAMQLQYGLVPADRGQGIVDILLVLALYLLFWQHGKTEIAAPVRKRALALAVVFTLVTSVCGEWLTIMRYEHTTNIPLQLLYYTNAFAGTFLLYNAALALLLQKLAALPDAGSLADRTPVSPRKAFWICFFCCWGVYFLFLLNQYPGSMESDHMRQLQHLLDGYYENRNPLVNSILVFGCVQLVRILGGSMNAGVFLYSLVQMTLVCATFAYAASLIARAGFSRKAVVLTVLFYALVPYNIFYSYGMWKDTFFAAWMLLSVLKVWGILQKSRDSSPVPAGDWVLLFAFTLLASLSRNSGWSALLIWVPCIFCMLRALAPLRKKLSLILAGGVAAALFIMGPIFSALGVDKTADSITAACIPLQQVGAVLCADKELTPQQQALIDQVVDVDAVKQQFDPACADPMKDLLYPSIAALDANLSDYVRLWVQLGLKYPMTYLRAYRDHLKMYFDPSTSSEVVYKWIYPNIFDVSRDSKLLPQLDFGYYENILELPAVNLLKRPGAVLWAMLLLWQVCALRKNRGMRLLYIPLLAIFGGLFLTAPVALLRYVYTVMAAIPLLVCWPFWRLQPKLTDPKA